MAITYTWAVVRMDCYPEYQGETDVVFSIQWNLSSEEAGYTGYTYGAVDITLDPADPFVPYADITEAIALGWVQEALGPEQSAAYEADVASQIVNRVNPATANLPLPWV